MKERIQSANAETLRASYQLRGLALFRFAFNWFAFLLLGLSAINFAIFGMPQLMPDFVKSFYAIALPAMMSFACWNIWPLVWKVETNSDGIEFHALFQKTFVLWTSLEDVQYKRWGNETIYEVQERLGKKLRFPYGMKRQEELLELIRKHVPERLVAEEKESRQDKLSLFRQGFFLVWAASASLGGLLGLTILLGQLLIGNLTNPLWIVFPIFFFAAGLGIGANTLLRAKNVLLTSRGFLVKTWIHELDIAWQDIKSIRKLPFGKSLAIKTSQGWFILGKELNRFDELSKFFAEHTI